MFGFRAWHQHDLENLEADELEQMLLHAKKVDEERSQKP